MIRFDIIAAGIITALLWAGAASAVPLTCQAVVSSPDGGRLEVTKLDPVPASTASPIPLPGGIAVFWYPPTSDTSINLELQMGGQSFENLNSTEMNIQFAQDKGSEPEQFKMRLSMDGMPPVTLEGDGISIMTHAFTASFRWDRSADIDMAEAIGRGGRLKVEVLKADNLVQTEMFRGTRMSLVVPGEPKLVATGTIDTAVPAARRALLAQARHLIETSDPSICRPSGENPTPTN